MLARLLQAGVWVNPSQRCTRMFQSVCQKNTCSLSLSSSIFVGSNPTVCNYSISPVVWICPSGRKRWRARTRVRENISVQDSLSFGKARSASVHLAEQCKSKPCLRVDTVLSQTVPKEFFPHCAGGTQIFSRCFCMSDDETTLLPLRRITYYEKDDYQWKPKGFSLQKR